MSRRSRSRGAPALMTAVAVVVIVGLACGGAGTGAFSTGAFDRGSAIPVESDADGLLGLDIASSVGANTTSRLVTVSNHFDSQIEVTVALRGNATEDADLVVDGTTVGDSTTVSVAAADKRTVDVAVDAGVENGTALRFDVDASGDSIGVSAHNRSTTITN